MPGVFKIKNLQDAEFTLTHPDGVGAVSIESNNIATKSNTVLTGIPIAPTATVDNNSTQIATTAYVDGKMVLATAVTASGTAIDFTGIPSWVKKVTVMFNDVSTNGTSPIQIQLGSSSGIETTGYYSNVFTWTGGTIGSNTNTGFILRAPGQGASSDTLCGAITVSKHSGNLFVASGTITLATLNGGISYCAGRKSISASLDRVRITTANGTDTFDAGSIKYYV